MTDMWHILILASNCLSRTVIFAKG